MQKDKTITLKDVDEGKATLEEFIENNDHTSEETDFDLETMIEKMAEIPANQGKFKFKLKS